MSVQDDLRRWMPAMNRGPRDAMGTAAERIDALESAIGLICEWSVSGDSPLHRLNVIAAIAHEALGEETS